MLVTLIDITPRKRAERAVQEEAHTLETLNRVGRTLAAELDLERVVQSVTDAATSVSGAEFGAFFYNVLNDEGEAYLLYTLSGAPREAFAKLGLPRNTAVFAPNFAGLGTVRLHDVTLDPARGGAARHRDARDGRLRSGAPPARRFSRAFSGAGRADGLRAGSGPAPREGASITT